ncbi:hypothetical protein B0H13DRAFT_1878088 [Mycena leptocephala]|nr:hypothetical protein B0H13DRAFT_1878088 [Mycena leptocephala]
MLDPNMFCEKTLSLWVGKRVELTTLTGKHEKQREIIYGTQHVGGMELTIPLLVSWMPASKAAPITTASGERTPLEFVKIQVVHTGAYYTNGSTRTATSREYLRQRQLRAAGTCGEVNYELRTTTSVVSAIRSRMMPDAEGPSLTD